MCDDRGRILITGAKWPPGENSDYRAWRWTVIHDRQPMTWQVESLMRMRPNAPITTTPTEGLVAHMSTLLPGEGYTAHSIKRGALNLLAKEAVAGNLDPRLLPLLAKHSDPATQYPATTLRYIQDKVALALMLGTQHAIILL